MPTAGAVPARKRLRVSLSAPTIPTADGDNAWDDEETSSSEESRTTGRSRRSAPSSKERRKLREPTTALQRARRTSLPRPASPRQHRRSVPPSTSARPLSVLVNRPQRKDGVAGITQHPAGRRGKILSPLPVNHSVSRTAIMPAKRVHDTNVAMGAPRMTRRTSGSMLTGEQALYDDAARAQKRGRSAQEGSDRLAASRHAREDDVEMEQDASIRPIRRLRSTDSYLEDDDTQANTGRQDQGEEREDAQSLGQDETEGESSQDEYCLQNASTSELRRLLRTELVRLYAQATGESPASAATLNKDSLIQGIVNNRFIDGRDGMPSTEEEEMSEGADSPRPYTSHEASPVNELDPRKITKKRGDAKRTMRPQHVPTPPHSDESSSAEETTSARPTGPRRRSQSLSTEHDAESTSRSTTGSRRNSIEPIQHSRSLRPRRSSTTEEDFALETTVPRPTRPGRRALHGRTRSANFEGLADALVEEEEELAQITEEPEDSATPIAHRTRHGRQPSDPASSPRRPGRAAKSKAVARIKSVKGKERSDDDEDDDDDEMEEDGKDTSQDETALAVRGRRRRGASRRVSDVEPPPSDADEESGGEETNEDEAGDGTDEENEVVSHLRGTRAGRKGKVIALRTRVHEDTVEDEEQSEEEEDSRMEDDEDDEEADVDLDHATSKTLLRRRRDDLVKLCEERKIAGDGTKKELVHALLQWRETHHDSDASSDSDGSTASGASTMTARAETKTQAMRAIETARPRRRSVDTPLLMRAQHSASPEKPHTAARSKGDEQEEVNALDLESLQLQDKEIAPEKLTKLEKVGSGGFKDVYKGMYRKKVIAIADIRGHLTDMDIKELGLLRDLRHPNIVHFIGVSIPKEPLSSVPVMIVTELCANGDLFDYLRGVPHPPFLNMLEIMLGIAHGLQYLHTRTPGIIHRDIKSSNILITANGVAKLNDFGLARIKNSTRSMIRSLVGTVNWQAPELWVPHPRYNEKVDVYSVGLVFWETLQWHQPVKRYPFEGLNEHAIYDQVGHKKIRPSTASMRRAWGGEVVDLVSAMWDQDPASRPSMTQVVVELGLLINAEKARMAAEKKRKD